MKGNCFLCKEKDAEGHGIINIDFRGVSLRVVKEEKMMCEDCFKKRFNKMLERYGHILGKIEGESIEVDWKAFCREVEKETEGESVEAQIVQMLLGLEVLQSKPDGNYEIMDCYWIVSNPRFHMHYVWFKNYDDALKYAFAKYAYAQYSWNIRRIMGVWTKQDLIEQGYGK